MARVQMRSMSSGRNRRQSGMRLASTDEHRMDEELALIDQPGVERVRGEGRPADGQVA
ncbi:MAG: hypothetical protein QOI99_1261, partial [Actinomycetota bacterium]|nr:hypothetical protein [Actinomycetota bacterium]